jgi:hypothetical protein
VVVRVAPLGARSWRSPGTPPPRFGRSAPGHSSLQRRPTPKKPSRRPRALSRMPVASPCRPRQIQQPARAVPGVRGPTRRWASCGTGSGARQSLQRSDPHVLIRACSNSGVLGRARRVRASTTRGSSSPSQPTLGSRCRSDPSRRRLGADADDAATRRRRRRANYPGCASDAGSARAPASREPTSSRFTRLSRDRASSAEMSSPDPGTSSFR